LLDLVDHDESGSTFPRRKWTDMSSIERDLLKYLAAAIALTSASCAVEEANTESALSETAGTPDAPPVFLEQGWSATTRAAFYQTTQGSRMLPYSWFVNLEQATSRQRFKAPANMRRMGFLVDGITVANPDELPVGFAKDVDPVKGDQIGLTCAGCHTGELEYNGTRVRIDGGQSLADLEQLQQGILDSLNATLADNAKFGRFVLALGATDANALRAEMVAERDWWTRRITRSAGLSPHGPSRVDAFTVIANEVACELLGVPANCPPKIANAPTQFPYLWGSPDFQFAQYNSSVHSPIGRNVGEVTGVFAEATLGPSIPQVISSANLTNLHALETWLKSLQAPSWPAEILGPIDSGLAAQGADLYAANCASCHPAVAPRSAPNAFGKTFAMMNFSTPLGALGTDPMAAITFPTRRADPGPWAPIAAANNLYGPDGKVAVFALLSISGSSILQRYFAINGFNDFQKIAFLDFRESMTPTQAQLTTYKARPLNGVALTAPYLHNGSVPSLWDLLLPPAQRPTQFYVGNTSFDPVHVGYSTEQVANSVLFDTTKLGNGNGGHVYGTSMTDAERYAIIEYIKTL
jgi:mono/diheme cytochrome c family protein